MPAKSDKQRRLMAAICNGNLKKKGISKEDACKVLHGEGKYTRKERRKP